MLKIVYLLVKFVVSGVLVKDSRKNVKILVSSGDFLFRFV